MSNQKGGGHQEGTKSVMHEVKVLPFIVLYQNPVETVTVSVDLTV